MEYWVAVDGERYGPYDPAQVQQLVTGGQLVPNAEVWFPDYGQWVAAPHLVGYAAPLTGPAAAKSASSEGGAVATLAPPVTAAPAAATATSDAAAGRFGTGWAGAAFGVGLVALALSWLPVLWLGSLALGVVGLLLVLLAFRKTRRRAGGKGLTIAGLALSVAAIGVTLATQLGFVGALPGEVQAQAPVEQQSAAESALQVSFGGPTWSAAGTTYPATVTNTATRPVTGGMFTAQAVARNGAIAGETVGSVPALQPGQSATVVVVFAERVGAGATVSVTTVDAYGH